MVKRTRQKTGYMPTLDGWRAIAILSVIFFHDSLHLHALGVFSTRWLYEYGDLGVDLFFAISGLLICSRLLDEERINGKIHLRGFYVRRGFRILPPVFLYLGVISILSVAPIAASSSPPSPILSTRLNKSSAPQGARIPTPSSSSKPKRRFFSPSENSGSLL